MNNGSVQQQTPQKRVKKVKDKNGKHIGRLVFVSVLLSCVLTVCIVCGFVLINTIAVSNGDMLIDLREYQVNQNQTSIIYYRNSDGNEAELMRLHGAENRIWLSLDEMPKVLQDAFIALEDKRFKDHSGVDWIRTIASATIYYNSGQGGSTITQQLIKNLTQKKEVTFVRKFKEIQTALNVEKHFSKDTILEAYLNTLYLGEGCYGVKTAVEKYFGKEVSEINCAEAAVIASITQAPYQYDPLVNPDNNRERQLMCLNYMLEQGKIDQAQYDEAVNYKLVYTNSPGYVGSEEEEEETKEEKSYQSFYVDYIIECLIDDFVEKFGYTESQATQKVYYGGLKIYACIDPKVQAALEDTYVNRKTFPNESGSENKVQSAMTIMDYTGRVVAICGEAGPKSGNRGLNRATSSPRQPGSSIKPLTAYGPAIDSNLATWSTKIQDYAFPLKGKMWPSNYGGGKGSGSFVTLQNGLCRSLNTISARLVYSIVGVERSYEYLTKNFHISTADPVEDVQPAPLATGGMYHGITTLEMASAYATFGNGGKYYEPYSYFLVTNSDGTTTYFDNTNPTYTQAIGEDSANVMCQLLQTVTTASGGTGTAYKISGFQTYAKTGTTTDEKDRWFCGGTPYYVAAVWYGYDHPKAITNVSGNPAGKIFKNVFDKVHKDLPSKEFEMGKLVVKKAYCASTGLLAGAHCTVGGSGWYKLTNMPKTCTDCTASSSSEQTTSSDEQTTASIADIWGGIFG